MGSSSDMGVDKVAEMEVDMVADMGVDIISQFWPDFTMLQFGHGRGLVNWAQTFPTRSLPGLRIF